MKNFLIVLVLITFFSCKKEEDVVPTAKLAAVNTTDNTVSVIGTYYAQWPINGGYAWKHHAPVFKIDNNTVQIDSVNTIRGFKMVFAKETSAQVLYTIPTQNISYKVGGGTTVYRKVTAISDTVYFNKTSKVFTCSYIDSTANGIATYNLTMTKD